MVVYATMAFGSQYNHRTIFLVSKILAAVAVTTFVISKE